jgi:serine/threonine protein kinase
VKSTNIMVDARGNPKLMDFDIAKHWEVEETGSTTATGQVMGTPDYMSPEYARGKKVDARSDTYSLGVVIYEMFTGRLPLKGDTAIATIMKHLHEAPPLRGPKAEKIPPALVPVLEKALAKAPDRRHPSARALAAALQVARTETLGQPVAPPVAKKAAPLPALLGALNPLDATVRIQVPEFLRKRKTDPTATSAIPVLLGALDEEEEAARDAPNTSATLPGVPAPRFDGRVTPVSILIDVSASDLLISAS